MYTTTEVPRIKERLSSVLSLIDEPYIETLLMLHKKLARKGIEWMLSGDLGEALKTVQVTPDCLEIVTTRKGAAQVFLAVQDCNPTGVYFQTHKLPRNSVVNGKEYPIYIRSYFFEFTINDTQVKVYGDAQYRIDNWEWGSRMAVIPEHVYVAGEKTAVVPLQTKLDLYEQLGWTDRAGKIRQVLAKRQPIPAR